MIARSIKSYFPVKQRENSMNYQRANHAIVKIIINHGTQMPFLSKNKKSNIKNLTTLINFF